MKKGLLMLAAVVTPLVCGVASAQEEEKSLGFTYATYMYCDNTAEDEYDAQIASIDKPVMDKLVEDGVMTRWGYMRHHTGGQWRRIRWFGADSVGGAIAALDAMGEALEEAAGDAEPSNACDRHDDYIWELQGGTVGKERGKVGISVYFSCEIAKEERADEIHAELFAPVLDEQVRDGKITSWGWQSHVIGGWFRRLQTVTATDYDSLLSARAEMLDAVYSKDNDSGKEFAEICGPHHDYLWNIVHEAQ